MLKKIAAALLCSAAPAALLAQDVELRSSDGFISVEGEIVGFNGTMLSVATSVGVVSVPASEVVCYGDGCATAIADSSLGLSADVFEDVVLATAVAPEPEPAPAPEAAPAAQVQPRADTLTVSFSQPGFANVFSDLSSAFATSGVEGTTLDQSTPGQLTLGHDTRQETATLQVSASDAQGDITLVMAPLTGTAPLEYQGAADWALIGPFSHQMLGLKAFAVIVSPDVDVAEISMSDLAGIYAGEIDNWSALGGADKRILPLQLPVDAPTRDDLIGLVMDPADKDIASSVLTMADEATIASSVNQFPGSISLVGLEDASENRVLPVVGSCGLAVAPEGFSVVSGDYPLIRPVMARIDTQPSTRVVREMFDFAATGAAQEAIAGDGFVDAGPVMQDPAQNNERLVQVLSAEMSEVSRSSAARMFELLFDAERLSPTMRSGTASGAEGGWNRAMFGGLADMLAQDDFAGREIVFVGFADSTRGDQAAIDASVAAASEMRAAFGQYASDIVATNNITLSAFGFGNVAQVACYDGQVARDTHGHVEIWMR